MKTKTIFLLVSLTTALSLSAQTLENIIYTNEVMTNSQYSGYTLNNVTFEATNVSGSNFSGTTMDNVIFHVRHDTGLSGSKIGSYFSDLDFSNSRWNGGSISGQTDVVSGSSTTTYRVNINLYNANFSNAIVNNVSFQSVQFDSRTTFENADLYGSTFFVVDLQDSTLKNTHIAGATFIDTGFNRNILESTASYKNKKLNEIFITSNGGSVNLSGVDFSGVNLRNATLFNVNLTNANFTGADLRGSMIFGNDSGAIYKNTITSSGILSNISMQSDSDKITIYANDTRFEKDLGQSVRVISDTEFNAGTIEIQEGEMLEFSAGITIAMNDQINIIFDSETVGGVEDLFVIGDSTSIVMSGYDDDLSAQKAFIGLFKDSDGNAADWAPESVATFVVAAVPEPSAYTLIFGIFAVGLVVYRNKR